MLLQSFHFFTLIAGSISEIFPNFGTQLFGFPTFNNDVTVSASTKAIFIWFVALLAGYGLLATLLLQGKTSNMQSIGYAALLEALFMIDCIYLRKWNIGIAPDASNYVFLGIPLLTGLVIFLS